MGHGYDELLKDVEDFGHDIGYAGFPFLHGRRLHRVWFQLSQGGSGVMRADKHLQSFCFAEDVDMLFVADNIPDLKRKAKEWEMEVTTFKEVEEKIGKPSGRIHHNHSMILCLNFLLRMMQLYHPVRREHPHNSRRLF